MGLADDIRRASAPKPTICAVCAALEQMTPTDRDDVEQCIADASIPGAVIARVLHDAGYKLNPDGKQVRRHRRTCIR
jgi:hypothetical protein